MLYRKLMVAASYCSLEQGECVFDRVRVDFALHIFLVGVADFRVLGIAELRYAEIVGRCVVGHDLLDALVHAGCNGFVKRSTLIVLDMDEPKGTAALPEPEHYVFVLELRLVAALLSADVGLVNLDR